jgi:hypothetical protein
MKRNVRSADILLPLVLVARSLLILLHVSDARRNGGADQQCAAFVRQRSEDLLSVISTGNSRC